MAAAYFCAADTIEASSLLTRVFKSVEGVDLVGFSGLMLALTEDTGLAQGPLTHSSIFARYSLIALYAALV